MYRPGGDLGEVKISSNHKDPDTVKRPGKHPRAVYFQPGFRRYGGHSTSISGHCVLAVGATN